MLFLTAREKPMACTQSAQMHLEKSDVHHTSPRLARCGDRLCFPRASFFHLLAADFSACPGLDREALHAAWRGLPLIDSSIYKPIDSTVHTVPSCCPENIRLIGLSPENRTTQGMVNFLCYYKPSKWQVKSLCPSYGTVVALMLVRK
jgi:hypothetical protein